MQNLVKLQDVSFFGDHFIYFHDLYVWLANNTFKIGLKGSVKIE